MIAEEDGVIQTWIRDISVPSFTAINNKYTIFSGQPSHRSETEMITPTKKEEKNHKHVITLQETRALVPSMRAHAFGRTKAGTTHATATTYHLGHGVGMMQCCLDLCVLFAVRKQL